MSFFPYRYPEMIKNKYTPTLKNCADSCNNLLLNVTTKWQHKIKIVANTLK